jgi:hypothetical protein
MSVIGISYRITLDDGREQGFDVTLDDRGLYTSESPQQPLRDWVRLECNQCPNCPLTRASIPIAPRPSELIQRYRTMGVVNKSFIKRLRSANKEDGALNVIVLLDVFTELVPDSLDESLKELEGLFGSFLS